MKPSIYRRIRRRATHDTAVNKKDNKQEQSFFSNPVGETFFHPAPVQRKCADCEKEEKNIQRMPEKKEEEMLQKKEEEKKEEKLMKKESPKEEDKKLQKKDAAAGGVAASTSSYIHSLNGKGTVLPAPAQQFFSERMGYNFSNVKVHTDQEAQQSAKEVNAKAYTVGNHIVFNEGQYNTESTEGKKLMAHELTHVVQQQADNKQLQRTPDDISEVQEQQPLPPIYLEGEGSQTQNTTHNANCAGVSVSGNTTANYGNSFSANGTPQTATTCTACTGTDCITISGTVVSVFTANPSVTLPAVPGGLNACEQNAVRNFINTTLRAHEQQHVAAFNTYRGTVRTPFSFTGCRSELDAHVQGVHDAVEVARRASSDAASAQLDANGANQFTITCVCPDPVPDAGN